MIHVALALDNGRIDDVDAVVEYLDACPVLFVAAGLDTDPLLAGRPMSVPIGSATDGTYAWPLSVPYFARVHGVAPETSLVQHIRDCRYVPPALTADELAELRWQR